MDAVVIESPALRSDEALARVVAAACTAALAEGTCIVGPAPNGAQVSATVDLDDQRSAARIELRNRTCQPSERGTSAGEWHADAGPRKGRSPDCGWNPSSTLSRWLRFSPADSPTERWKSIGLVIGTLAEGEAIAPAPLAPAPSPARAPPSKGGDAKAVGGDTTGRPGAGSVSSHRLWLDAGVVVGPALDDGTWRAGPAVAASHALGATPVSAGISFRFTARPADDRGVAVTWLAAAAGLGARLPFAERRVWVEPRFEIVAEQMRASIEDASSGRADDAALWSAGARLSAQVAWMPAEAFGIWAGGEVTALQAGVSIRVGRDETARLAPFGGALVLGARVIPF